MLKKLVKIFGYGLALGSQIAIMITFHVAYFLPEKETLITINTFGEANIELFMLWIMLAISLCGFYFLVRR